MIWCRALLLIFLALPVTAQEVRSLAPIDQAKYLIAIGLLKDAEDVLGRFLETHPDDIEARFLEATIAAEETRWSDAIKWYRGILSQHPDLLRVRLDYARALFEDGQDEEADYNFRLALPDVPEAAAANIYGYLNQIETRKRFTYGLSIGGSLDSDINAAPAVSQLTLFGLPFTLSPGNRATSGVGVIVNGSAEYRLPLAEDPWQLRLRFGGGLYRAEYFGGHSRFDDMIARVYSGPQLLFDKGDVSLLGVANMRWYGNDPYNWGYGPRAEIRYSLTNRILLQAGLEYTPDWYHTQTFENGQLLTGLATTSYVISPASFVSLITGIAHEHAAAPGFSNLSYRIGLGYQRELPLGITLYFQPEVLLAYYAAPSAFFGTTRRDRLVQVQLTLSKRDFRFWGFIPSVTYNFSEDDSNQPLFSFRRHQLLIGLSKAF